MKDLPSRWPPASSSPRALQLYIAGLILILILIGDWRQRCEGRATLSAAPDSSVLWARLALWMCLRAVAEVAGQVIARRDPPRRRVLDARHHRRRNDQPRMQFRPFPRHRRRRPFGPCLGLFSPPCVLRHSLCRRRLAPNQAAPWSYRRGRALHCSRPRNCGRSCSSRRGRHLTIPPPTGTMWPNLTGRNTVMGPRANGVRVSGRDEPRLLREARFAPHATGCTS